MKTTLILAAVLVSFLSAPVLSRAEDPDPFSALNDKGAAAKPADNPAPSLGTETKAEEAKPNPEEQATLPLSSIPGKTENSVTKNPDTANKKDIYDEYYDYLDSEKQRQTTETDYSMRTFFPHENGAWDISLMYSLTAFNGYNFNYQNFVNPQTGKATAVYGKTQGGTISATWFPIHSLTVGRLGFGVNGGIFWTKFDIPTSSIINGSVSNVTTTTTSKPQNMITYGARAIYELDYWLAQILVPFAELGFDEVAIQQFSVTAGNTTFANWGRRQLVSQYWGAGAHFYLNRIEPVVGSRALVNVGVRKFYLTYHYLQRTGDLAGGTHSLGLTFEF